MTTLFDAMLATATRLRGGRRGTATGGYSGPPPAGSDPTPVAGAVVTPNITGTIYHVKKTGLDTNPGTEALPFLTINKGISMVGAGGAVYVYNGEYREYVAITAAGTSPTNMVHVMAAPGQTAVIIDGTDTTLTAGSCQVQLYSPYIFFAGIEVRNSKAMGLVLKALGDVVHGCKVHHCQENGILTFGNNTIIEDSEEYSACLMNTGGTNPTWPSGLSAARQPSGVIIRRCKVHDNWGEGISTYEADTVEISDCQSYSNWTANIYASNAPYVNILRNFVWNDVTSPIYTAGNGSYVGIMMGDEKELPLPQLAHLVIDGNIVTGCRRNLYWWGLAGHVMNDYQITNNTFFNANTAGSADTYYNVQLNQAAHVNVRFQNNIIVEEHLMNICSTNVTYSNNAWSNGIPANAAGGTGNIGGPTTDLGLAKSGSQWLPDYYKLLSTSPCIGKALAPTGQTLDHGRRTRDAAPDIGAWEYLVAGAPGLPASTQLIDAGLAEPDHYFDGGTLFFLSGANAGISRVVTRWNAQTRTFDFGALPATIAAGDQYVVFDGGYYDRDSYVSGVNDALRALGPFDAINESLTTTPDTDHYTLPAGVSGLLQVWIASDLPGAWWEYPYFYEQAGTLYLHPLRLPKGGVKLRLVYAKPHALVFADADPITPDVHPQRLSAEAAYYACTNRIGYAESSEPNTLKLLGALELECQKARAYPIPHAQRANWSSLVL